MTTTKISQEEFLDLKGQMEKCGGNNPSSSKPKSTVSRPCKSPNKGSKEISPKVSTSNGASNNPVKHEEPIKEDKK